jgi:hypothetical protein
MLAERREEVDSSLGVTDERDRRMEEADRVDNRRNEFDPDPKRVEGNCLTMKYVVMIWFRC